MAFKTPVVDRVPTYPGRVKLTPVAGTTDTYDLVRADSPIEEGTPLNKALFDQKAYTLTENVTVYVDGVSGNNDSGDGSSARPFATIQKAVDALPKWLDGHMASISIAAGTYEEKVELNGIQGGIVELGSYGRAVTVRGILIDNCNLIRLNVNVTRGSLNVTPLNIRHGSTVQFGGDCIINGGSVNTNGIVVESGSTLTSVVDIFGFMGKTTINNCKYYAIYATGGSKVALGDIAGSGNGTGLYVADGAVVSYNSRTMTATTTHVTVAGGRIYSSAQTSIPNY